METPCSGGLGSSPDAEQPAINMNVRARSGGKAKEARKFIGLDKQDRAKGAMRGSGLQFDGSAKHWTAEIRDLRVRGT